MSTDQGGTSTVARDGITEAMALALLLVLSLSTVLILPSLVSEPDRESRALLSAFTAVVVLSLTAVYIWAVQRMTGWERTSAILTFCFLTGIATVKFVVSPGAFLNTAGVTLEEYLWLGAGVLVLYLVGLSVIYWVSQRYRDRTWPWTSKAAVVLCLLVFAAGSRYLAAHILTDNVSDYLSDTFRGAGVWLFVLLIGSVVAAVEAFDRAGAERAFRVGVSVIIVYHALWAVFMYRLFG
jgi:hypothetical protein